MWVMLICLPAHAQQDPLQVLVLNSYDESAEPYFQPTTLFKKYVQQNYETPIAFQDIDLRQRGEERQSPVDEPIAELLLRRYTDAPPRLVLAIGPPAIDFWVQYRDSIFPDALFIAMARESILLRSNLRPFDALVATEFSFSEVFDNILRLKPDTSQIVMVFGDSPAERTLSAGARQEGVHYSDRFSLEFTNDMAIPEIQDMLAGLPSGAVVFFGILSADVKGVMLRQYSGLAMARAASTVPVFGTFSDQMGNGIVGGRLIRTDEIGKQLAATAQELLAGPSEPLAMKFIDLSVPVYDWRELDAWGISRDRLPPGSKVLFEPPTFWEIYAGWILGVAFVVLAQSWLVVALLRQRRQRAKAELAHASLGRRLITAHEDERKLVARELHDDLSQRLARVAIDASFVRSDPGSDISREVLDDLHPELVRISKDVHDMSYRLHPSLVDDLGLVAALQSEIERVQRRADVTIDSKISNFREHLSSETALCIFRIAQEALNNAVKHAQADEIEIELKQDDQSLMLTVSDNGIGFDFLETRDEFSLGLSSMQERATLAGGTLKISSGPGQGTTVALLVPFDGAGL